MSMPTDVSQDLGHAMAAAAAQSGDTTPLETPRSLIYRGPSRVWKLRKIAGSARHDAAVEEYYRGSVQAHGLYEGVEPFGALCMGRIPAAHFLAEAGRKGPLSPRLMDATADALARYHAGLTPVVEANSAGRLRQWITQSVQRVVGAGLPQAEIIGWVGEALTAMDAVEALVNERGAAGFVRPTHGNFTLAKLGIWQEAVVALAPVSASDPRSVCDTGFELALLLMDLEARNARESACRVLSRYLAVTGDLALLRLLPLYMSLRALDQAAVGGEVGAQYIKLARGYLQPAPGYAVAIGGLPGVGKSTLARALASEIGRSPGALVLRSDEIRKRAFKVELEQPLPASAYDAAADRYVFDLLRRDLETVLAAGHAVIVDETFVDMRHREVVEAIAAAAGVGFSGFWLDAPLPMLEKRLDSRVYDASDATVHTLREANLRNPGAARWTRIDATKFDQMVVAARAVLDAEPLQS